LEIWWNTRVPVSMVRGAHVVVADSPIVRLATVRNMDRCRFRTEFTVPDVPPGKYPVRVFVFDRGGYGLFGWHHFTIR
jgi:hypothetical protein